MGARRRAEEFYITVRVGGAMKKCGRRRAPQAIKRRNELFDDQVEIGDGLRSKTRTGKLTKPCARCWRIIFAVSFSPCTNSESNQLSGKKAA